MNIIKRPLGLSIKQSCYVLIKDGKSLFIIDPGFIVSI